VTPGQKVPVTNADSAEHTATSDVAGLFAADDIKNGKTVTFTAPTKAGTYTFHCTYHASMHGTLVVKG
jgi:plastocyanin